MTRIPNRLHVPDFALMKRRGERVVMLTVRWHDGLTTLRSSITSYVNRLSVAICQTPNKSSWARLFLGVGGQCGNS